MGRHAIRPAPPPYDPRHGPFLTSAEVAALLRITPASLRTMRSQGRGPVGIRVGDRGSRILYAASAVTSYLLACRLVGGVRDAAAAREAARDGAA
jgi:hypothetical protein